MTDTVRTLPDRFNVRPIVVPVAIALLVGTVHSFLQLPSLRAWFLLELLCLFFGVPALLTWLVVRLVRLAISARRRNWQTAVSQLLMSICVLPLVAIGLFIGPYIHFGLSYPYYLMEVKKSASGESARTTFNWGGSGFVGSAQTDRWLVYDPTDKTAKRTGHQEKSEEDPYAWYEVEHLLGNFYLVERHQS